MSDPRTPTEARWLTPGVRGIGAASFLADVGHEMPIALPPNLLTTTLGAPAAALGLIEGVSDGLAGAVRLAGGTIADYPQRRRAQVVAGYTTTAVLSSLIGAGHRRLAGRRAPRRRLGRPRPARPGSQRPACRHRADQRLRAGLQVRTPAAI